MTRSTLRIGAATLALAGVMAPPAAAQFAPGMNPAARGPGGVIGGAAPAVAPALPGPAGLLAVNQGINPYAAGLLNNNPLLGGGGLGYYYANPYANQDPYGGYLRGAADVISAQGQFMIQRQQAALTREQVRQAKLDTYRRTFDQWKYIRENTPKPSDDARAFQQEQIKRSLTNPPRTEIYSAKSLNDLLTAIDPAAAKGPNAPKIDLDPDALRHINVSKDGGPGTGNIGLLRDEGKLTFPLALRDLANTRERKEMLEKLNTLSREAHGQALNGRVDAAILRDMSALSRKLNEDLTANVSSFDFSDYSDAKKFLRSLDDGIAALGQPDAGKMINSANIARGKTVQELVQNMLNSGYRFAPAVPGDEAAYQMLHSKLASFYNGLTGNLATP
jgi:hypothetical protein